MDSVNSCLESLNSNLCAFSDYITEKTGVTSIKQAKVAAVVSGVVAVIFAVAALGSLAAAPISSAIVLVLGVALAVLARDAFVVFESKDSFLTQKVLNPCSGSRFSFKGTWLLKRFV